MLAGDLIIDGTVHGFDLSTANKSDHASPEEYRSFQSFMHQLAHLPLESTEPGYLLTEQEYIPSVSPEALAHALFVESDVDIAFYHHVPIAGFFAKGISPLAPGLGLRDIAPGRTYIYGGVDTFNPDRGRVFAEMEEYAELGLSGLKFYPTNGVVDPDAKSLVTMLYDDPERAYPFFEKAREVGITHLAFHKAFPVGPSVDAVRPGDLLAAAVAFPDLTFEIVHAGFAFTEETALELMVAPNLYANLELSGGMIVRQPRRFAEMLGCLLQQAGHERILFASGSTATHVDPVLRAFQQFEMPRDLVEGHGYPELTAEMKSAILGGNIARMHDLDLDEAARAISDDEWAKRRAAGKEEPWRLRREQAALAAA